MRKKDFAGRFADATRLLLYGNGDTKSLVRDLANILSEYDECKPMGKDKLTFILDNLNEGDYDHISSDEWE